MLMTTGWSLPRATAALCAALMLAGCESPTMPRSAGTYTVGSVLAAKSGNSDAAHACQLGGYAGLTREDGTPFENTGDCVSYAAHGGTLVPLAPPPSIASFTVNKSFSGCGGAVAITAVFSGGTGVVVSGYNPGVEIPVTSGVVTGSGWVPAGVIWVLTVTNAQGVSVSASAVTSC